MKNLVKQLIKEAACKFFGHGQCIEEVYAELQCVQHGKPLYCITQRIVCLRCDKVISIKVLRKNISRAEMLHDGWFIDGNR